MARRAVAVVFIMLLCLTADAERRAPGVGVASAQTPTYPLPLLRYSANASSALSRVELPRLNEESIAAITTWNDSGGSPMKNGVVRDLAVPLSSRHVTSSASSGQWRWQATVAAPGAQAMRLHLVLRSVPEGTVFWVYGSDATAPARAFDASLAHDGEITTPSVEGESITVEVAAPASIPAIVEISKVVHLLAVGTNGVECIQDATCYAEASSLGTGVGRMSFVKGVSSYLCTGGLLMDREGTFKPFFLTANHCISTAAEASTLEVTWDYRSLSCWGSLPALATMPKSYGASLLVTSAGTDVTLLRLNTVPGTRAFLGWDPDPIVPSLRLKRVSHPAGFVQLYSESLVTTTSSTCSSSPRPNFIYSYRSVGGVQGGSSGAPVYVEDGYVVGQLMGGCGTSAELEDPCSNVKQVDGSLAASWSLLAPYLDPTATPTAGCTPSQTAVCLLNGRFKVSINYRNQFASPPQPGDFSAARLNASATNPDVGIFGLGNAQAVEVVVRIADARPFAARFDVYYGGLTDLEYWVEVTDTVTRTERTYYNPPGKVGGGLDRASFPTN